MTTPTREQIPAETKEECSVRGVSGQVSITSSEYEQAVELSKKRLDNYKPATPTREQVVQWANQCGLAKGDYLRANPRARELLEYTTLARADLEAENAALRDKVKMLTDALEDATAALEHRWEAIANRAAPVMEGVIDAAHTKAIKALAAAKEGK